MIQIKDSWGGDWYNVPDAIKDIGSFVSPRSFDDVTFDSFNVSVEGAPFPLIKLTSGGFLLVFPFVVPFGRFLNFRYFAGLAG